MNCGQGIIGPLSFVSYPSVLGLTAVVSYNLLHFLAVADGRVNLVCYSVLARSHVLNFDTEIMGRIAHHSPSNAAERREN